MILGLASLVLGIVASSITSTIARARAAGAAAGRAFAAGFGRVRAGLAPIAAWFRTTFPRLSAMVGRVGARFSLLGARIRALSPSMNSLTRGSLAYTRSLFRMTRAVSSVAGAFQGSNGLWYVMRNGRRVLLTQRHQVTQTLTAWGRFVTRLQQVGQVVSSNAGFIGALTAGIVVLAPAIGAALGAAVTAAVAIGVVAAGVAIAAKQSDRVQRAFAETFKPIGAQLSEQATVAFEGPLIKAAGTFKAAWKDVGPVMGQAFEKASKFVDPLATGIAQLVKNMIGGGGFLKLLDAAGPVMSTLSTGLSRLGGAFDNMFRSIASAGPGLTKGMIVIFALLSAAIVALGNTIEFLSKAFDKGTILAQRYAEMMSKMLGWLPGVGDLWKAAAEKLGLFNDAGGKTREIIPLAGTAAAQSAQGFYSSAAAADRARAALIALTEKISGLINAQLGADQAALAFQRALDAVTQSVKDNGRNIDITTAKGQANIDVVLQAVAAANAKREADIKLAGGEKASEAAVRAANQAFQAQIAQLEATLRKAGLTQAQIDSLIGKYKQLAATPDITKNITTNVITRYRTEGSPNYNRVSGVQVAYASGTQWAKPGVALVGEEGPELIRLKGGERIWPADETAKILAQSKSLAAGASQEMGGLNRSGPESAEYQAPSVAVKVYIGNEEFQGYVAQISDERIGASQRGMSRKLAGR